MKRPRYCVCVVSWGGGGVVVVRYRWEDVGRCGVLLFL